MIQIAKIDCLAVINQSPAVCEFGISELISLFDLFGVPYQQLLETTFNNNKIPQISEIKCNLFKTFPLIDIRVPNPDLLLQVIQRSVLIHYLLIVVSRANKLEEIALNIKEEYQQYFQNPDLTSRIEFITIDVKYTHQQKMNIVEKLILSLGIKNKICLVQPDITYYICIDKEESYVLGLSFYKRLKRKERNYIADFQLANRIYLGPVSLHHELSFLMANQAQVKEGDLVLDPFAGTGSALVAASYFGATCFGCEIDKSLLYGYCIGVINQKSSYYKEEIKEQRPYVNLNFTQYELPIPDLILMDINHNKLLGKQSDGFFDAIITDPPYGIRASIAQQDEQQKDQTINRNQIYKQMFVVARKALRKGGKIVFLQPVWRQTYTGLLEEIEEGFKVIDYREQVLADRRSRLMITMEKL